MCIKILGTKYDITVDPSLKDEGIDGLCMQYDKKILIRPVQDMLNADDSKEAKIHRWKEVLRHELIHAFFIESGLDNYSSDEVLVNYLAIQLPKMVSCFDVCDCIQKGEEKC